MIQRSVMMILIMQLLLLVMVFKMIRNIGLLKINGHLTGEKKDTLNWQEEKRNAVFILMQALFM